MRPILYLSLQYIYESLYRSYPSVCLCYLQRQPESHSLSCLDYANNLRLLIRFQIGFIDEGREGPLLKNYSRISPLDKSEGSIDAGQMIEPASAKGLQSVGTNTRKQIFSPFQPRLLLSSSTSISPLHFLASSALPLSLSSLSLLNLTS